MTVHLKIRRKSESILEKLKKRKGIYKLFMELRGFNYLTRARLEVRLENKFKSEKNEQINKTKTSINLHFNCTIFALVHNMFIRFL